MQQLLYPLLCHGGADALEGGNVHQVVPYGKIRVEAIILGQIPQKLAVTAVHGENILAVPGDAA